MSRKIFIIVSIGLSVLGLTSCSTKEKYNEQEKNIIADYIAQTVIEHSEGYDDKLIDTANNPFLLAEEESFIESLNKVDKNDDLSESNKQDLDDKDATDVQQDEVESGDNKKETIKEIDFSNVLGYVDGVEVFVTKYDILKEYSQGAYIIDIEDNERLIKIEFEVKNTTNRDVNVKTDSNIQYILSSKQKYYPLVTAIENDIIFFEKNIKANQSKKAVILFKIAKSEKLEELRLEVINNEQKKSVLFK